MKNAYYTGEQAIVNLSNTFHSTYRMDKLNGAISMTVPHVRLVIGSM